MSGRRVTRLDAELGGDLLPRPANLGGNAKTVQHNVGAGRRQLRAMPRPIPLVEPVTSATLPASARARLKYLRLQRYVHDLVTVGDGWTPSFRRPWRNRRPKRKYQLASKSIRALLRVGCHSWFRSARFAPYLAGSRSMEMHQVRYFLAVAQLLNFTRAAEECNVTQPSLTRAIKQPRPSLAATCSAASGRRRNSPNSASACIRS